MPLTAEQRRARARLAANIRHHPDKPELNAADSTVIGEAKTDRKIDAVAAAIPGMTAEQAIRIKRIADSIQLDDERLSKLAVLLHPGE